MGHYYKQDGTPCYKQADGRDTIVTHARKQNLVPSVTEVINVAASPGLDIYKQNQLLEAVIENPPVRAALVSDNEPFLTQVDDLDAWRKQVVSMSKEHAKQAAESGAIVHNALEHFFKTGEAQDEFAGLCKNVLKCFTENNLPTAGWIAEKTFASEFGFGGCVDLHHPKKRIVLDFKTKSDDNFSKARAYESHHMQTAAYTVGLFSQLDLVTVRRYNLFINKDNFSELKLTESKDFSKDWLMFESLLNYWKLSKNYDSGFKSEV